MKTIDFDELDDLPGKRIAENESFTFDCFPGIACFNRCCRNLNLFLHPYDILRLKKCLGISSDLFLERYVDVVLRPQQYFPEVLLKMAGDEKSCAFLEEAGCRVYADRPDTCRKFPMEQAVIFRSAKKPAGRVYFLKPPDFCKGPEEQREWTPADWNQDPDDKLYDRMALGWAEIKHLMQNNPWGNEGPEGPRAKMTFMAAYNIDRFREFIFDSTYLKRYKVKGGVLKKIREDDAESLKFSFAWIRYFLWGMPSKLFRPRH
jgi:Fe-S-cluster containining protein